MYTVSSISGGGTIRRIGRIEGIDGSAENAVEKALAKPDCPIIRPGLYLLEHDGGYKILARVSERSQPRLYLNTRERNFN